MRLTLYSDTNIYNTTVQVKGESCNTDQPIATDGTENKLDEHITVETDEIWEN